ISGYSGGHVKNPTYEQVKAGNTGHYEVVQITFDPDIISYQTILNMYWQQIDPTDPDGQFHDRGPSYRTAIFYHNERQKMIAEESKRALEKSGKFDKPISHKFFLPVNFIQLKIITKNFIKKIQMPIWKTGKNLVGMSLLKNIGKKGR